MTRIIDLRKKINKKEVFPVIEKTPLVEQKVKKEKTDRFEWGTSSFYYNPQKKYLALVVIALFCGAGVFFLYYRDILLAIFLILSSLVIIFYTNNQPTISRVIVNRAGVIIDDSMYYYKNLKSFWLDYSPHGLKELSLETKKWYMPYVKISIENEDPVEIRSLIVNFVPEKEHEKSLVDLINRKMGL